jgi:hypothetical protein
MPAHDISDRPVWPPDWTWPPALPHPINPYLTVVFWYLVTLKSRLSIPSIHPSVHPSVQCIHLIHFTFFILFYFIFFLHPPAHPSHPIPSYPVSSHPMPHAYYTVQVLDLYLPYPTHPAMTAWLVSASCGDRRVIEKAIPSVISSYNEGTIKWIMAILL